MARLHRSLQFARWLSFIVLGLSLLSATAAGSPDGPVDVKEAALAHLSQSVTVRYWLAHPELAPPRLQPRFQAVQAAITEGRGRAPLAVVDAGQAFNLDTVGLPQNEESITVCRNNPSIVLGGTNDYRGLLDPAQNFTGWHLSTDGGNRVSKEGRLPPVGLNGEVRPSGGDPVVVADDECNLYASSLNYDPTSPFGKSNGIGLYKTTVDSLQNCLGGADAACWPTRRAVAQTAPPHFLDKEWFDVGVSGDAGKVVWVVFSDFNLAPDNPSFPFTAELKAVRCDADLVNCTDPILISGADRDIQFGDVTIGPDGRTYITWSEIQGELERTAQTFIHKLRIAPAGTTEFGPTQIIAVEDLALPFEGFLHANDFRVATYPKHEVVLVNGRPRIVVVWDGCTFRPVRSICEEARIKLRYSDDDGVSWSPEAILSIDGDNYFPTLDDDGVGRLAVAWYTNRFDTAFHNQQDVELVTVDAATVQVMGRQRVTASSNETEADPVLGGFFIGDYVQVAALPDTIYIHYNANYRHVPLLGSGIPIPQQDNFLAKVSP